MKKMIIFKHINCIAAECLNNDKPDLEIVKLFNTHILPLPYTPMADLNEVKKSLEKLHPDKNIEVRYTTMRVIKIIKDDDGNKTFVIELSDWITQNACISVSNNEIDSCKFSKFLSQDEIDMALYLVKLTENNQWTISLSNFG